MSWAIANGQGITPKGCPETIDMMNLILEQVASPTLWQDTPEVGILHRTWKTLQSRRINMHQAPFM